MPGLVAPGPVSLIGPDHFQLVFTEPVQLSLREPEGKVETVEIQFRSGLVASELDHRGACRIWLPPTALKLNIDIDPWRGFLADPTPERLASAVNHAGAPTEAVRAVRENLQFRGRRGKPPALSPLDQWLRAWQMNIEMIWLQLKWHSRWDAAEIIAKWHGLKPNTVFRKLVRSTAGYKQFARIRNTATSPK